MQTNTDGKPLRLRRIPDNIVVHTSTETEAKELLAILHENGHKLWNGRNLLELSDGFAHRMEAVVIRPNQGEVDWYGNIANAPKSITLAEFKERYCEEEPPLKITASDDLCAMAKSEMETKELNLCELLKGHEGGVFYSPIYGEVTIEFDKERGVMEMWPLSKRAYLPIAPNGHLASNSEKGQCLIFPSRALYEQYPLDPQKAWSEWQEEQKKCTLYIDMAHSDDKQSFVSSKTYYFRTPADCDKCLSEIKAIIEKYSKK